MKACFAKMELPQKLLSSPYFVFSNEEELLSAFGEECSEQEVKKVRYLSSLGLPPVIDLEFIGLMLGLNSGLIWSFKERPERHYNVFDLRKGSKVRQITAPRVGLKIFQKWISVHLSKKYTRPEHVYGFVENFSHVDAALQHLGAEWLVSVDIKNFFQTTSKTSVQWAFKSIGYDPESASLLSSLTCYRGYLAQGAPTSPVLSNICFRNVDKQLASLAKSLDCTLTRYADDIVFSGSGSLPKHLLPKIKKVFIESPWEIAESKTEETQLPSRLKVHGLLVDGNSIRTTKGFRNKARAYAHLLKKNKIQNTDIHRVKGLLNYQKFVEVKASGKNE